MNNKPNLTEASFKLIYDRLAPKLVAFANSWSGDRLFAEDLVQDAFVQIWQKRTTITDIEKIDSLLYTIVRNNLINRYQKKLKEQAYLKDLPVQATTPTDVQPNPTKINLVKEHIEALPPRSKEVFLMSRKDGLTYKEIASELSISTKSVEKHVSKALKLLREQLKRAYLFFL